MPPPPPNLSLQSLLPSLLLFFLLSPSLCQLHQHPPPAPSPHPRPLCLCPHLTLLGLFRCWCPFGSGTAGAAAESRVPLPPLSAASLSAIFSHLIGRTGCKMRMLGSQSLYSSRLGFSTVSTYSWQIRVVTAEQWALSVDVQYLV
ncbi:hypothetical protein PAMP_019037 [Pampus punctatissimus]